jgi:ribose 1,5-bisphosphokinase PhnN
MERAGPMSTTPMLSARRRLAPRGREAVRQFSERLWRAAPDSRIEIMQWASTGDALLNTLR